MLQGLGLLGRRGDEGESQVQVEVLSPHGLLGVQEGEAAEDTQPMVLWTLSEVVRYMSLSKVEPSPNGPYEKARLALCKEAPSHDSVEAAIPGGALFGTH